MKYLTLLLPILFEAISEGLYLHGSTEMKVISKQVQVLMIASYFLLIWQAYKGQFKEFWKIPVIYVLFRFVIFNYAHNIAAGLPIAYLGTVSFVDRILVLMCGGSLWMILIGQGICIAFILAIIRDKIGGRVIETPINMPGFTKWYLFKFRSEIFASIGAGFVILGILFTKFHAPRILILITTMTIFSFILFLGTLHLIAWFKLKKFNR